MKKEFSPWWLLIAALAFAVLLGYAYVRNSSFVPNVHSEALGQLGDFVGGLLNPVVSILTLIVAINVWRLQKEELAFARNEMEQTKEAMEDQAKTAEQQRREQRFFDFLSIYRSTLDSIENEVIAAGESVVVVKGKRAFRHYATSFQSNPFREFIKHLSKRALGDPYAGFHKPHYLNLWQETSPLLEHYFRVIFTLLREARPILGEDCFRYMKLLRAQLSKDEVNFIALNLLLDEEGRKMQQFVATYGLLKHMPLSQLRSIAERELPPGSFGRQWVNDRT